MFVKCDCKNLFFIPYFWYFQRLIIEGIFNAKKYQNWILSLDILFIFFANFFNVKL